MKDSVEEILLCRDIAWLTQKIRELKKNLEHYERLKENSEIRLIQMRAYS